MPTDVAENLLTANQLAAVLSVTPRTVCEWAREGVIPEVRLTRRIRRFRLTDVMKALERKKK